MNDHLSLTGIDTLTGIMHNASPRATTYLIGEMEDVSFEIFNESQKQVPRRYGFLAASGHVEDPEVNGNDIRIVIGYGGAAAQYALFVHENLAARHRPPTKAKFLEDPFNEKINELPKRVRERLESAMLSSYPQSPAKAATAEGVTDIKRSLTRSTHSKGMSSAEIHNALQSIAHGDKHWHRAR